MSSQSYFFNPQDDRMSCAGSGLQLPRLSTAQRLALSVGLNDAGLSVFDLTAGTFYLWTGTAWTTVVVTPYTEGTWTPTLTDSGGGRTYTLSAATGRWSKISNLVLVTGNVTINTQSGVATGELIMGALPFASVFGGSATVYGSGLANQSQTQLNGFVSGSGITLRHFDSGVSATLATHTLAGAILQVSATYIAA